MDKLKYYIIVILVLTLQACKLSEQKKEIHSEPEIILGDNELLSSNLELIKGKRIALVANKASVLSDGTPLLDTLLRISKVKIGVVFTPEHGYDINTSAGTVITDTTIGTIAFHSLYGNNKKPAPEMLDNIDIILFDLQDVGTRFYTYISTLYYVMQAAGENNIPLVVLDRPNPIGGTRVEGPVLDPAFQSFVGIAPIPVLYGMTAGELAQLFAGEGMFQEKPELKIIGMKNWRRNSFFDDYNLEWINPSPNIPDFETAMIYPSIAFLEGTNISEGRGTENPFKQIGAPFINSTALVNEMTLFKHDGISIKPVIFIPNSIPGKAENPKYKNISCNGITMNITNPAEFSQMNFSIQLLYVLHKLYPEKFKFEPAVFDKLMGETYTREMLFMDKTPAEIIRAWEPGLEKFLKIRTKYLLY